MADFTPTTPQDVSPGKYSKLSLRFATLQFSGPSVKVGEETISVCVDVVNAAGKVIETRYVTVDGPAVATYVQNQSNTILTRLQTKLGLTGTIT